MSQSKVYTSVLNLPQTPAVYAMFSGKGNRAYCANVGVADKLKQRIQRHIVKRDSSVTTGTSAVSLNLEYINKIRWWKNVNFEERHFLEAAELIAFEVFGSSTEEQRSHPGKSEDLIR